MEVLARGPLMRPRRLAVHGIEAKTDGTKVQRVPATGPLAPGDSGRADRPADDPGIDERDLAGDGWPCKCARSGDHVHGARKGLDPQMPEDASPRVAAL